MAICSISIDDDEFYLFFQLFCSVSDTACWKVFFLLFWIKHLKLYFNIVLFSQFQEKYGYYYDSLFIY